MAVLCHVKALVFVFVYSEIKTNFYPSIHFLLPLDPHSGRRGAGAVINKMHSHINLFNLKLWRSCFCVDFKIKTVHKTGFSLTSTPANSHISYSDSAPEMTLVSCEELNLLAEFCHRQRHQMSNMSSVMESYSFMWSLAAKILSTVIYYDIKGVWNDSCGLSGRETKGC